MNRAWCAFAVFAVVIGSSVSADAAPPVRLAKAQISPRVLRVHHAVLQLLPLIVKGGGRHDSTSSANATVNCPGGGSLSATYSVSSSNTGTTSGTGDSSYSVTFTNCKTSDDTLGGSMTFTYSSSASNGGATNTIAVSYGKANVLLKSVSSDPIVLQGLTVSTVATTTTGGGGSGGGTSTKSTASGSVTVGGTTYTYSNDPLDVAYN